MMMNKYRVHEVAKDFDKPSKSVIDLLGEYFEEPKKHMTALEEKELDVIFETFTQQNEVESFDAYFAMGKPAEAEQPARPAEKEAPAAKKAPEQPAKPGEDANKPATGDAGVALWLTVMCMTSLLGAALVGKKRKA